MTQAFSGDTGASAIADGTVTNTKIAAGAVTPDKLSGQQSGSAPLYGARAWCVFDGTLTGTNAPTAGGNVTSVTRNSAGNYTVNLTSAMPDANYCVIATFTSAGTNPSYVAIVNTKTASSFVVSSNSTTGAAADMTGVNIVVFR